MSQELVGARADQDESRTLSRFSAPGEPAKSDTEEEREAVQALPHREGTGKIGGSLSPQALRHQQMRRTVLARNPEVRALYGEHPRNALWAPVILAIHWSIAWAVSDTNLLTVFLVSFCVGQVVLHSAAGLIHESAHRLVFRDKNKKYYLDLFIEFILTSFSRQLTYHHEHVSSHHPQLGNYLRDYEHEDVCRYVARSNFKVEYGKYQRLMTGAEVVVNLLPLGFLVSGDIFPRIYGWVTGRSFKDAERDIAATRAPIAQERVFIAVSIGINVLLFALFGFYGWLYHIWSLSIFLGKCGVTNLGQSLSEHVGDDEENPTKSTYWWGNRILFNTGYHNEHHTFPNVPGPNLPKLKALAPDVFHSTSEKSYARLWFEHVAADFKPTRWNAYMGPENEARCGLPRH
jgi:sphingolipid delta-4 desaturase